MWASGWVFGALVSHADRLATVEAAVLKWAHILLRQVRLVGVAGARHELLAFRGGRREAVRVRRCVEAVR